MAKRWTIAEEKAKRAELRKLYVEDNKTIGEIAVVLGIDQTTVYDRLKRLGIPSSPCRKVRYCNRRSDITIPVDHSEAIAEFIGVLLGDGHITPTQVVVTLGTKDRYVEYVVALIRQIFKIEPRVMIRPRGAEIVVYFGSTAAVRWLLKMGLQSNKVKFQVDVPGWIFGKAKYMRAALRGLIDTDGSVYRLKNGGVQMSFTNRSEPLLQSARWMFHELKFHPSRISGPRFYLTKRKDLDRFFHEVGFGNQKHTERFKQFVSDSHGWVV